MSYNVQYAFFARTKRVNVNYTRIMSINIVDLVKATSRGVLRKQVVGGCKSGVSCAGKGGKSNLGISDGKNLKDLHLCKLFKIFSSFYTNSIEVT